MTYRNDFGLEDYYSYQSQSAARAGTGYVSDHMQRLTFVNPIISSASDVMPFGLSLVYSSALNKSSFGAASDIYTRDYSNMLLGAGWKLSAQQCIQSVRISGDDANTLYWVYTDGDGTQHYFYETSSGVYEDEDGLGLKITLDTETGHTNFKMTDDYGNETFFRDGILTYRKDIYGNGIYYCYNYQAFGGADSTAWYPTNAVHNQLTSIWRLNNGGSSERLARFVYDSNGYVTGIYDEAERETLLYYNTSGGVKYLDYIIYPDSVKVDYSYSASGMAGAYDAEANYGIWYTYDTDGTVNQFYEYYLNGTAHVVGNTVSCWNSLNRCSYRDWGADHRKDTSDDLRLEVVFDNWGRTICSYTTNYDGTKILGSAALSYTANSGTSRTNNRISSVGSSGMTAVNLLPDGSMEYSSAGNWTNVSTGSTSAAVRDTANGQVARNGTWGLKFWLSDSAAATDTAALCHSAVYLTAGKDYTFSGYFKTSTAMTWGSAGKLQIKFLNSSGGADFIETVVTSKPSAQLGGGWQRVSATFRPETSGYYRPGFWLSDCTDLAFIDDVQLEQSEAASSCNLVQNGSFENGSAGWSWGSLASTETYSATPFGSKALKLTGSQNANNRANRTIPMNCSSDTTFLLSGWAKGYSAPNPASELGETSRYFGLALRIDYSDGTKEFHSVPFEWSSNDWQCTVGTIVPKESGKTIEKAVVFCAYDYNSGYALFDNISLRQEPVQTYAYNAKGNVSSVTQSDIATEKGEYAANGVDLTSYTAINGVKHTYTYNGKHDVETETSAGVTASYTYSPAGNRLTSKLQGTGSIYLSDSAYVSEDKNHTTSVTDVNGSTTTYTYYAPKELLIAVKNAKNVTTNYTYNNQNDRPNQTYQSGVAAIIYGYEKGALSTLTRKSFASPGGSTAYWQRYGFPANDWGQRTAVTVARSTDGSNWTSRILASYEYEPNGGNLKKLTYGNGDSVSYEYDQFDRLIKTVYNDTGNYAAYAYTAEGALAKVTYGTSAGQILAVYSFEYDSLGRLIRSRQTDGQNTVQQTEHLYDAANRLSSQKWTVGGKTRSETYTYDGTRGTLTRLKTSSGQKINYFYEELRRMSSTSVTNSSGVPLFNTFYAYRAINNSRSSLQVTSRDIKLDGGALVLDTGYTYDALGNIQTATETLQLSADSSRTTNVTYSYDDQNQLVTERYTGAVSDTINYTYDTAGNILSETKSVGSSSTTKTYTYGDGQWVDLLMKVNGTPITYDGSGNPLTYYNGKKTFSGLIWEQGRQLTSVTTGGKTTTYAYDADGIRTEKVINGVAHHYVTLGGKLVRESFMSGSNEIIMDFSYDESGRPFAVSYSKDGGATFGTYYYATNLQGDVVMIFGRTAVTDANGNTTGYTVKSYGYYTYDAWGNVTAHTATGSTPASTSLIYRNPLRYRGYIYDNETGFYYLQSRYYDPANHRFINADSFASTGQGFTGTNMFAYCNNNPVYLSDHGGNMAGKSCTTYVNDGGYGLSSSQLKVVSELKERNLIPNDFNPSNYQGCTITEETLSVSVDGIEKFLIGDGTLPYIFDGVVTIEAAKLSPYASVAVGLALLLYHPMAKSIVYYNIPVLPNGIYQVYTLDYITAEDIYINGANGKANICQCHSVTTAYILISRGGDLISYDIFENRTYKTTYPLK